MSFVTIAVGTTRRSRVRTLSLRALWAGAALAASALLVAGAGVGHWATRLASAATTEADAPGGPAPITVEQLGALSARLHMLERQASQLRDRLGMSAASTAPPGDRAGGTSKSRTEPRVAPSALAASAPTIPTSPTAAATDRMPAATVAEPEAGRGGPMLPPRVALDLAAELGTEDALQALEPRLAQLEHEIGLVADAALLQGLARMRLPTRLPVETGELVSSFGNRADPLTGRRAFHEGLDFAAPTGTEIHAAAGGKVTFAGFRPDFGWVVEIDHGNALATRYAHASRLYVRAGDIVTPGDRIAAIGSTGRSTGPHLHFEVLRAGAAIDPRRYLAGL